MTKQKKLIDDENDDLENINEENDSSLEVGEEFEPDPMMDYRSLQAVVTYDDEEYIHSTR